MARNKFAELEEAQEALRQFLKGNNIDIWINDLGQTLQEAAKTFNSLTDRELADYFGTTEAEIRKLYD
jgi:hypothetical protein